MLGAGSWGGTALAMVLAENGHDTLVWTHRAEQAEEINQLHTNKKYLPETILPVNLHATSDMAKVASHAETIVVAVPTKAIREVCEKLTAELTKKVLFVHVSKGIEPDSLKRISEIIAESLPAMYVEEIVVLSGPSHAEEVVLHHPTTVTAACANIDAAEKVQDLFMNQFFRVYTNEDIIGVEIGGSVEKRHCFSGRYY